MRGATHGHVRRCHGDLHLDNVFLFKGKPTLFDAIEFEDDFACIDVLYDLAFLLMDLERHGARPLAQALLSRYLELTGDYDGLKALPLFLACRAGIRAHAAVSRARAKGGDAAALAEGKAYLDLARGFLKPQPPRLVVVGGLSGTGKTTIARRIAPALGRAPGAVVLRSDVTRKRLMGVADETRLPQSAYTPDDQRQGRSTRWPRPRAAFWPRDTLSSWMRCMAREEERSDIAGIAAEAGAPFDGFWLTADPALLIQRIAGRRGDASDATAEVLKKQIAQIAAPTGWKTIDVSGTPDAIAGTVLTRLKPQAEKAGLNPCRSAISMPCSTPNPSP